MAGAAPHFPLAANTVTTFRTEIHDWQIIGGRRRPRHVNATIVYRMTTMLNSFRYSESLDLF